MKTLFLNPNASDEITATLRRHVARGGWPTEQWAVAKLAEAPRIIGSADDNALAEAAMARALPALADGFDRVVTMSSVDTGYDIARRRFGEAAYGFTRSVLALHRRLGHRLNVVTFDHGMTALYESAIQATGHLAVVADWHVVDRQPASVAAEPRVALDELRGLCNRFDREHPVFVVGAVGLELSESLRQDGMRQVIDPVADLLTWLATSSAPDGDTDVHSNSIRL